MPSRPSPYRQIAISAVAVVALSFLLLSVDFAGGTGWQRIVGAVLLIAIAGNLWVAFAAWRRRG